MVKERELTISKVNQENFRQCAKLEVADDQKPFVAPNLHTIAWAYVDQNLIPYAICEGETVVGLAAVEFVPENEDYDRHWVPRFMIGEQFQGKGYGRLAMEKIIRMIVGEHPQCERVRLSVVSENSHAIQFYKNIGFVETDEMLEDERVMDYFI